MSCTTGIKSTVFVWLLCLAEMLYLQHLLSWCCVGLIGKDTGRILVRFEFSYWQISPYKSLSRGIYSKAGVAQTTHLN